MLSLGAVCGAVGWDTVPVIRRLVQCDFSSGALYQAFNP